MKYINNFLTNVILKLDYNPLNQLGVYEQPKIIEKFKDKQYSVEKKETKQVTVQSSSVTQGVAQQTVSNWILSKDNELFTLTPTSASLEAKNKSYTSFDEFLNGFSVLYDEFYSEFPEIDPVRLGLRYINEITLEGEAFEWSGYLKEELCKSLDSRTLSEMELLRSMHQITLRDTENDDSYITFTYGMPNPDFPSPIAKKLFILDYDCSIIRDIPKDSQNLYRTIETMNSNITNLFESCITDDLRTLMKNDRSS